MSRSFWAAVNEVAAQVQREVAAQVQREVSRRP